ncbi:MAG TPA: hypothetical protein VLS90_04710, partial [Thermodesulfobacteriota bacterium]|nr:hypothetical protein [Thermodesulfobacteriota bacterium]
GIGFQPFISSFLLLIPIILASIPLGLVVANCIAWCIPPARRVFDREAEGIEWAAFGDAMGGLAKMSLILVPICLLLSFVGAATLRSLK